MTTIRERLGIFRSVLMYYGKPFNRRKLKRFYSQFIKEGDLCFDIGAHLGNRIDAWSNLKANTIAVEPQPQCLDYLNKRFGRDKKVTILPKAVSNKPGTAVLNISTLTPTVSTFSGQEFQKAINDKTPYEVKWDKTIEVEMVTLDQLIAQYGRPVFCKIDVEDLEAQVLQGLSTPIDVVSFEYFSYMTPQAMECIELLENLGNYEYNWSYAETLQFESDWIQASKMKEVLNNFTENDRSGDIYARLSTSRK